MSVPTSFWCLPQKSQRTPSTSVALGIELSMVGQGLSATPNADYALGSRLASRSAPLICVHVLARPLSGQLGF